MQVEDNVLTASVRMDFRASAEAHLLVGRLEFFRESFLECTLKPPKEQCGIILIERKDRRTRERHQRVSDFQSAPQNAPTRDVNQIEGPKI